ncbi:glucose-1-phosphate thymidylyltransferase [Prochlorococcus marinus str. MU1402]|uniref:glucose-1-phosphate thymidylyltransferase RfbA n=1 Tax=Prochlorococcus marinus TaxID=1219 RepID=UPI001AD96ECA|nr:glucose-1-phosphate thymidylyltransferase RfbA [Prochlorococcus marinus]MBO8232416.1 glucose-1-phosphate thymidylyltransferase RfbA [Prochlorococcus marinus XMU1402]MBW3057144.1 glucose-1-phosphate thymidylyltransferase [Prochlorococcus marinus str. MU1402]
MSSKRKGIILAGGKGTRLNPITNGISKQLIPLYDKPIIYYPITTLMLAEIRDILIITSKEDLQSFKRLLGNGNDWGLNLEYKIQPKPNGIAEALLIAEDYLQGSPTCLILGDNFFHGQDLVKKIEFANKQKNGATIFTYQVNNPSSYGVVEFNKKFKVINIIEKPSDHKSNFAITGLYFYDSNAVEYAKEIIPSKRGELEITELNRIYLEKDDLHVQNFGRGMAWLDTGTFDGIHEASSYIRTMQHRQGLKIGCPEEVAWRKGWINNEQLKEFARKSFKSGYGEYLLKLAD